MAKFTKGQRVAIGRGRLRKLGHVVKREGRKYRVFTMHREQLVCDARSLRPAGYSIMILESNLSEGREALRSDRQRRAGVFLEELFRSMTFQVLREKVHTVEDLKFFMRRARDADVEFVHYCGHGADLGGRGQHRAVTAIALSAEQLYLPSRTEEAIEKALSRPTLSRAEQVSLERDRKQYAALHSCFGRLEGKVLIFSACELGRAKGIAQFISEVSGARAVIAYDDEIYDYQSNVAEALLYARFLHRESKKTTIAKLVQELRDESRRALGHFLPVVCFVDGRQVAG